MELMTFTKAKDPKHLKSNEYVPYGDSLPNTVEPIGDDSYDGQIEQHEDRFSITPLYTVYHEKALSEEFMIDRHLGSGAIKRADGTIVSADEIGRLNHHLDRMHDMLSYLGMPILKVFNIVPSHNYEVMMYDGEELLDGNITIETGRDIIKGLISLDVTILDTVSDDDECKLARLCNIDPKVVVTYRIDGEEDDKVIESTAFGIGQRMIEFNTNQIELTSIVFPDILPFDTREVYVHSILVAC